MELQEHVNRRSAAADEFDRHEHRNDGASVASSLATGMTLLRTSMFTRVHDDVERMFGMDSMLSPLSEDKSERKTKIELELYQIAQAFDEVRHSSFTSSDDEWFLQWLAQLRLGEHWTEMKQARTRLSTYVARDPADRRLEFSDILTRTLPEASRAPLVLFRLYPLAVRIVTAMAFQDTLRAAELRNRQSSFLPAIADCPECHGRPLDNEEQCRQCGNPLWKYEWLVAAD